MHGWSEVSSLPEFHNNCITLGAYDQYLVLEAEITQSSCKPLHAQLSPRGQVDLTIADEDSPAPS